MTEHLTAKLSDFVIVAVDSQYNDEVFLNSDTRLVINPNWRPTHNARICGRVLNAPEFLTGRDSVLHEKYPGSPRPMIYRGHEEIERRVLSMPKHERKHWHLTTPYRCGSFEPEYETLNGVDPEIEKDGLVYFHYGTLLDDENYLMRYNTDQGNQLIYRVPYSEIFCFVKGGKIKMLNSYVFVSQVIDPRVETIDTGFYKTKGIMKGNLVVSVDANDWVPDSSNPDDPTKKVKKEKHYKFGSKYLTGKLEHIGRAVSGDSRSIRPGTQIIFRPGSEFENVIEGKEYWTMRQWDIVAQMPDDADLMIWNKDSLMLPLPVGDYLMIQYEKQDLSKNTKLHVWDQRLPDQKFNPGELFILPETQTQQKKKSVHKFGVGRVLACGENCKKNWMDERVYYNNKSLYYLYMEDFDVVFVREGDVYGRGIS